MESSTRPWGSYTVLSDEAKLSDEANHKVKRIEVLPGRRLSYQKHSQRAEHWFFVGGTGALVLDGVESQVSAGESVDIPLGAAHRIANPSAETVLVFIEVQHGTYFGEDDIERLDDDYGRS